MRVYAKISLGGNPRTQKTTPVDKEGQTNPVWNFTAVYTVGKNAVKSQDIKLLIQFFCVRTSQETNIGELSVSLAELFDRFSASSEGEGAAKVNYPVKRGDADSQGEVNLSYKFGDVFDFVRPPTDWGKVCWKGTKLIMKGGMLCVRLTLLAGGNFFDVPIDAMADVAYTSYDILSSVFGAGDFLADIPWGEADFLADISCPGTDLPVIIDTPSSLQTNVCADGATAGRNLAVDDLSIPSTGIQDPVDVTSCMLYFNFMN